MTYYQILKQRRIDLKLSIQDVSSQTRLAPQYIQAIEENRLDVFSDDYSFVRYFVHSYCDAIGVNWNAIQNEVDAHIRAYARSKNMALTQAQRKMVEQMPSVNVSRTQRKSKSGFQKRVSGMTRKLHWSKQKTTKTLIIAGVSIVALLFISNMMISMISKQQAENAERQRLLELREKEEETQRLAEQRKQEAKKAEISISSPDDGSNVFTITNVLENEKQLRFEITIPEESYILIYKDDVLVTDDYETTYTETFKKNFDLDGECTFTLEIGNYSNNEIYINGKPVQFSPIYWYPGEPAVMKFEVKSNSNKDESTEEVEQPTELEEESDS